MKQIILTTESGSDVPQAMAETLGIRIAPMHVILGNDSYNDREIPVEDIFSHFKDTRSMPTTSAVNPQEYTAFFTNLRAENPKADIVHIAYSSKASSTYQNAAIALEELKDRSIWLVDSKNVSCGIALLLWKTSRMLDKCRDGSQAVQMIEKLIERERVSFLPDTLEYLRAGGRVSNAAYLGTSLLRLKVLINIVDGSLVASKKYRGHMDKVSFRLLEDFVRSHEPDREAIFLFYTEGFSMDLLEQLKEHSRRMGFEHVFAADIGCVISCHGGPGAFGLAGFAHKG